MKDVPDLFDSAERYDKSINWEARFGRELPMLQKVLGPPRAQGLLDAGCGTGRHARALAGLGYTVVGADLSADMIRIARRDSATAAPSPEFVIAAFEGMQDVVQREFDGLYCLGNALAAAGTREAVRRALAEFGLCLRPGGRLFCQILNFARMRKEQPCVRGPRRAVVENREYVSVRLFHFREDQAEVTNVTLWHDGDWQKRAHCAYLYPMELGEFRAFCEQAGMRVDYVWGDYARSPFDPERSVDLLLAATRL